MTEQAAKNLITAGNNANHLYCICCFVRLRKYTLSAWSGSPNLNGSVEWEDTASVAQSRGICRDRWRFFGVIFRKRKCPNDRSPLDERNPRVCNIHCLKYVYYSRKIIFVTWKILTVRKPAFIAPTIWKHSLASTKTSRVIGAIKMVIVVHIEILQ